MKLLILFISLLGILTSCQHPAKNTPLNNTTQTTIEEKIVDPEVTSPLAEKQFNNEVIQYNKSGFLPFNFNEKITRFALGSCASQDQPMPLFRHIIKEDPQLFLFIGDNIYSSRKEQRPPDFQYMKLDQIPIFQEVKSKFPILTIWDDHDFGANDGGSDNPYKTQYRKAFLDYWSQVRPFVIENEGALYYSTLFGPQNENIHFIFLDTRFHRTPITQVQTDKGYKQVLPTDNGTENMLGDAQWKWLEAELKKPAKIKFIISSIQFVANAHPFERWGEFPAQKDKMIQLLKKTQAKNVFFLSGDRHIGTIAKETIKGYGNIYDLTASSINRSRNLPEEIDPTYIGHSTSKENFGLITIDWEKLELKMELRDNSNSVANEVKILLL